MPQTRPVSLKALFYFFPKIAIISIPVAIVLKFAAPGMNQLWDIIVNIMFTFIALKLMVVIHEAGHLIVAKWMRGTPKRMTLGTGYEVFRTSLAGIIIIINSSPVGGLAYAVFDDDRYIRWRYAAYTAGGVFFNFLVAALAYFTGGLHLNYFTGEHGIDLASPLVLTNALAFTNLVPFYTSAFGTKLSSDGLALLKIPFKPKNYYKQLQLQNRFFDAYDYLENHQYDEAFAIYKEYYDLFPEKEELLINISAVHILRGDFDMALEILQSLETRINSKKELQLYKGYIYHNLAVIYLVKENIELAWKNVSLALKALPKNSQVGNIYGAVLIERGDTKIGMKWLSANMDLAHPGPITLYASLYLMVACHQRKEFQVRDTHRKFIENNFDILDVTGKLFYKRNLEKMGIAVNDVVAGGAN